MRVREHREELIARVRLLDILASLALLFVVTWYWFVQVAQGAQYRALAENNRLRRIPVVAPRGLVFDRHEDLLVENVPSYNLMLEKGRTRDVAASLDFAGQLLERGPTDLRQALAASGGGSPYAPVLLAEGLSLAAVARFSARAFEHPEFTVEVNPIRLYRHGQQTAHLLGYTGEVSDRELAVGAYLPGELVGKKGIEKSYDSWLRGSNGEKVVVVDSRSRLVAEYGEQPATPGKSLHLTIDLALQQEAERQMRDKVGAVVALDPRNGEILAMVSVPSFNPNVFSRQLDVASWQAILDDPNNPLQNRVLQNTHSPGSVFKAVMAVAGLSEGFIAPLDRVYCSGSETFYNRPFRCWKPGGHGSVDVRAALKGSCDVFFYHLGRRMGIDRIARWARLFGFAVATGIDLEGEKRGLVPDGAWSLATRKTPWYAGETISVSIGQGPILTTPLQVASMMATLANGGFRITPHVMRDAPVPPPTRAAVSAEVLRVVGDGLWQVVNDGGTAAIAAVRGLDIVGKTGTVQVIGQSTRTTNDQLPWEYRDHAWFASFAPRLDPRLVIVVFVEHGGHGSAAAAPIAKAMYETYLTPSRPSQPS
jgi:penicillin-binding protein 2